MCIVQTMLFLDENDQIKYIDAKVNSIFNITARKSSTNKSDQALAGGKAVSKSKSPACTKLTGLDWTTKRSTIGGDNKQVDKTTRLNLQNLYQIAKTSLDRLYRSYQARKNSARTNILKGTANTNIRRYKDE